MKIEELTPKQLQDIEDRIHKHIQETPDGCWLWTGCTAYSVRRGKKGQPYGIIYLRKGEGTPSTGKPQSFAVRRVIYHIYNPNSILGELVIEATCGHSLCINPEHLVHVLKRRSLGPNKRG